MPKTTIKMLKDALAKLGDGFDDREIQIWLPGTYISLVGTPIVHGTDLILLEGNVVKGGF